jgi:hypothetical protein
MEGFVTSTGQSGLQGLHDRESWGHQQSPLLANSDAVIMFKPILDKFAGSMKSTLNHLTTVHNETCGCQIGSTSHEATNKVWNQKKVSFMELQKQSGLEFEDYLNRVLGLLLTNSIRDVQPLSESEFWLTLRTTYPDNPKPMTQCNVETMEEDLADINNLIAKDIGAEPNQIFMSQSTTASPNTEYNNMEAPADMVSASSPPSSTSSTSFNALATSPASSSSSGFATGVLNNVDELLRMKRKEKHMAPIDCTGISAAFGVTWKCKVCDRQHSSKTDCDHYRHLHEPRNFILNDHHGSSTYGLPPDLQSRPDGIYTGEDGLKPFTRLGPLQGQVKANKAFIILICRMSLFFSKNIILLKNPRFWGKKK